MRTLPKLQLHWNIGEISEISYIIIIGIIINGLANPRQQCFRYMALIEAHLKNRRTYFITLSDQLTGLQAYF